MIYGYPDFISSNCVTDKQKVIHNCVKLVFFKFQDIFFIFFSKKYLTLAIQVSLQTYPQKVWVNNTG